MATKERQPIDNPDSYKYRQAILCRTRMGDVIYSETKMNESDYMNLNNGIWTKLRAERLRMDGYVCQKCGDTKNVVVHHLRYPGVWGEEELSDLVTLCENCHKEIHGKLKGE